MDGERFGDGLHHGVPLLPPAAAGAAGVGARVGAMALLVLPRERGVLAVPPAAAAQRAGGGAAPLALCGAACARGALRRGLSALRARPGHADGQVLSHQQCAPAHARDAGGHAGGHEIIP